MLNVDDLPDGFLEQVKPLYTHFRKDAETIKIRDLLPTPKEGQLPFIDIATEAEKRA